MDQAAAVTLVITNAVFLVGFGWPLARHLSQRAAGTKRIIPWLIALLGIYFAECAAFSASMGTNVLSICLAVVWGLVFGHKLRTQRREKATKLSLCVSLYTCLPAVSFASILVLLALKGWPVLTVDGGRGFGIPGFVPWPMSTLLGFFLAVIASAVLFKTAITMGIVAVLLRRAKDQGEEQRATR